MTVDKVTHVHVSYHHSKAGHFVANPRNGMPRRYKDTKYEDTVLIHEDSKQSDPQRWVHASMMGRFNCLMMDSRSMCKVSMCLVDGV